jgi:hypothetical protein
VNIYPASRAALRLGLLAALLLAAVPSQSQTNRSVRQVPQPAAPAVTPGVAGFGTPSPSGLPSPLPNPAGLPPVTVPNLSAPATPGTAADTVAVPQQPIAQGGVVPTYGATPAGANAARQMGATGTGGFSAVQIAQSFFGADANHDGELTRGEFQRLSIAPFTFEEMDRNHDGIVSRFEYEDAVR